MAEWLKAPVLKTGRWLVRLVGSNPTPTVVPVVIGTHDDGITSDVHSSVIWGWMCLLRCAIEKPAEGGSFNGGTWIRTRDLGLMNPSL